MQKFISHAIILILLLAVPCNADDLTENVIKNGNFVLGKASWYARYWQKAKIDYLVTEDIKAYTDKIDSGYQYVVPVNNKNQSVRIMTEPFKVTKGEPFKCEIEVRIEGNPRNLNFKVMNADRVFNTNRKVGNAWEKMVLNDRFPASGNDYYRVELSTDGEQATILLRSAKLLQKTGAFSRHDGDFTFAAQSQKPLSLYEQGDEVIYEVTGSNLNSRPEKIGWSVVDLHGKEIAVGALEFTGGVTTKRTSLGRLPFGWYSVSFTGAANAVNPAERHSFSIVPKLSERSNVDPEKSFFGTHTEITADGLLAAKLMGFRWIRLNAPLITKWNAVEEKKGTFTYNDKAISDLKREGFGIVGTLDRTALWASTGKNDPKTEWSNFYGAYSYFPEDWSTWEKYVSSVVTHYKDDIRYWQIWNEPDIPFLVPPAGISNASAYDTIVRKTAPLVRRNNPEATLLGGVAHIRHTFLGPGRQKDFLEEMEKLKADENLDIFTFHHYIASREKVKPLEDDFDFVRALLHDSKRRYWVTELGLDCTASSKYEFLNAQKCTSTLDAASQAIKFNVVLLSKGVEKIFYYNLFFDTNGLGEFMPGVNVMWDSKEPRPLVPAYAIMTWLLDGAKLVNSLKKSTYQEFTFNNGKKTIKVVWADTSSPQTYTADREATFISIDGSRTSKGLTYQITDEPVYVVEGK